jgi:CubicO group peptidase (beta-lactamase class C family)
MRSGVKWKEFNDIWGEGDGTKFDKLVKGPPQEKSIIEFATKYGVSNKGAFNYSALDASISGAVAQKFLGTTTKLSDFFEAGIWAAIGAEAPARWRMDKTKTPIGACCFYLRARDLARFGVFVLKKGLSAKDEQAMPSAWFDLATTRGNGNSDDIPPGDHDSYNECEPRAGGLGYRFLWWLRPRPRTDFTAVGISGQFLHIYPDDHTVIVQISDWGRWKDGNFRECQSFLAHDALVGAMKK